MQIFRNLAVLLFCLFVASEVYGQRTPAMSQLPWWDYRPERIDNDYSSIIGASGTNLVANSAGVAWGSSTNNIELALPFPFTFMRTNYPSGYRMVLSYSGWMSFSGATYSATTYQYQYYPNTYYWANGTTLYYSASNKGIMPYWSDLQTSGPSSPSGGIYYRVDGPVGDRVLTIEWRVQGGYYPAGNVGNFQARLFEKTSAIEFLYGDFSINRTKPSTNPQFTFGYGALVGLNHQGQRQISRELTPEDFNRDEDNFMYFVHPDETFPDLDGRQPGSDTIAVTRFNTINFGGGSPYYPVWYSYYQSYDGGYRYYVASPWWHYRFPTDQNQPIGYRMRPILNDLTCDSVWFSPTNAINAYTAGTGIVVNARFKNLASAVKTNVPTRFDVYYSGAKIKVYTSEQQLVSPGARLGSANVAFNVIPGSMNSGPGTNGNSRNGIYEVRIYPQDPLEEDVKNDTCKIPYFILGRN
ncbi:MAG: hypothetical protein AB7H80_18165, partial [Candidatus Kapaibacterium sp.]